MTFLALGAKWVSAAGRGPPSSGAAWADRAPSFDPPAPRIDASAAQPTALVPRPRNWRRVSPWTNSWNGCMARPFANRGGMARRRSLVEHFVEVHQLVGEHGPGCQGRDLDRRV